MPREVADVLPLEGIHVLDVSRVLAGPYCCSLLGAMGADVIKVERPGTGDENRRWGTLWNGESVDFMNVNAHKRGITVNLAHADGQAIVRELARSADVLVENFMPGAMERYGLGYEALRESNPGLVYCGLSAFGERGPLNTKPGYDGTLQAFSGHMSITGELDGGPVRSGASVIDMGTGLAAYGAVMTALVQRGRTGRGQKVSVSLLQTAIGFLGTHAAAYRTTGQLPVRAGAGSSHLVPYGAYRTRDSHVVTGALNEQAWIRLCEVLGVPHLTAEPRYATLQDRVANRQELDDALHAAFSTRTTAQWVEAFEAAGMVIAPVNSLPEVLRHPQVEANDMIVPMDHPLGRVELVGAPMQLSEAPRKDGRPPPRLGEHTDDILRSIGYSTERIAALRSASVI